MQAGGVTEGDRSRALAPIAALVLLGLAAVWALPSLGASLPWETDPEPNATQLATSAFGIVLLTAGSLWLVARATAWPTRPAALTFAYLAAIATVKFILSPASFHNTEDAKLATYLWLGLVVMVIYLVALSGLYRFAGRPKVVTLGAALVFAIATRYLAALVLGRDVGDYLGDVFGAGGLSLVALLGGAALAAVECFRQPRPALSFRTGAAVIVVYHGLWALYMLRLFD
jgi:hypothetical protein